MIEVIRANTQGNLNTAGFEKVTDIPALSSTWELKSLADAANESQVAGGGKSVYAFPSSFFSPIPHAARLR